MGCFLEFFADVFLETVAYAYIELMFLIVPEHKLSHKAERIVRISVYVFTVILLLAIGAGIVLILQPNQSLKTVGYYLTFIPLTITVIQIAAGIIIRHKQKRAIISKEVKCMPNKIELAEIMYNKGMSFCDEVIDVLYSTDKLKRFVILRNDRGLYKYLYEVVEPFDEEEWKYIGNSEDALPAYWITTKEFDDISFYDSVEAVMKEIRVHPEYIEYFTK